MISVKDLPFTKIPASEAANVLAAKNGFLSFGGDKKKFAKSIEEGQAELCEVDVVSQYWVPAGDDDEIGYGVVLTKDGRELVNVGIYSEKAFYAVAEAPYGRFDMRKNLENDAETRKSASCKPGVVVHYFLGKEEIYQLITPEKAKDLKLLVPDLGGPAYGECLNELE